MPNDNLQFNVAEFMNESYDGTLDTKLVPIPEGEHMAQIGTGDKDVDFMSGIGKNQKPWLMVVMMLDYTDPALATALKREKVRGRYSIMLDLNEAGKLDFRPQRNVNLGKLRDAVNQNRPGPWNFNMLKGQPIRVKIKHKKNEEHPDEPFAEVAAVTRAI